MLTLTASNASRIPRFENQVSNNNTDKSQDQELARVYKPAEEFYYRENPYDRQLLSLKEEQVKIEMEHLESNKEKLAQVALECHARAHVSDDDVNVTMNSNVKWFESATANIQTVNRMTQAINEQENMAHAKSKKKKDEIIKIADDQNEDYMQQI